MSLVHKGSCDLLWMFLFHYLVSVHNKKRNAEWPRSCLGPCHFGIYSFRTSPAREKNCKGVENSPLTDTQFLQVPVPSISSETTWNSFHSSRAELGIPKLHFCLSQFKGHDSGRGVTGRFWGQTRAWERHCPWSLPCNGSGPLHWSLGGCWSAHSIAAWAPLLGSPNMMVCFPRRKRVDERQLEPYLRSHRWSFLSIHCEQQPAPREGVGNTELRGTYEDWPPPHPQLTSTLYYPHSGSSLPTHLYASTSPTNSQSMFLKRQIWPVYSCIQDHQGLPVLLQ